ncbi:MAG: pyridoxal-phosphate dependent enzyme [Anaerolineaceae bacterium]|jgi:cysteine synthase A
MAKIDLTVIEDCLAHTLERVRAQNLIIPTLAQQRDPSLIPDKIKEELKGVGLWDLHPRNLFRITWHNEPVEQGGAFGDVNFMEFPSSLTGVDARIIALVGKWFPTGVHKVGAAFGCLVPRLVTGQFDPTTQKAVWPSTGNYCRGGAYDSKLLGCQSIAILPEGMSKERFNWLSNVADEIIATPGTESNVKEIFDKCWELRRSGQDLMIFNQFDEMGNYLWHYTITGPAMEEVARKVLRDRDNLVGFASATGSAGTIAAGDYLKQHFNGVKIIASEALQCPTLLNNGFGAHRIEGIGDKHVPWVHNVRNTDFITAIDDNAVVNLARLFNDPVGREYLLESGVDEKTVSQLDLLGFSGVGNLLTAIKFAKWNELSSHDVVFTILTDSMELYQSRLEELEAEFGAYTPKNAAADYARYLLGENTSNMEELTYHSRKRIHNLKYYTWVEQQGKTYEEIMAQWYDPDYWTEIQAQVPEIDRLIEGFNQQAHVG